MVHTYHLLFLLLLLPGVVAGSNGTIFDALNLTTFDGNWSAVYDETTAQDRCNFPGQWYLITGVGVYRDDGDLRVKMYGVKWYACRSNRGNDDIGSSTIYNRSDWCGKVYYPYVVTERVWNAQPGYVKAVLNNTTKFMGVVPTQWNTWHPYLGRPDDMPNTDIAQNKHIFGWLTVAFENASVVNGTTYVANACNILPVYDVWDSVDGIKRYERCEDCMSCEDMDATFISMETTEIIVEDGDMIRVTVEVVLMWGYYCWNCWPMNQPCRAMWLNTSEKATFTATAQRPTIVNQSKLNCTAYITYYNNSRSPTTFIDVSPPESVIKTMYTYNNNTIIKHGAIGIVQDQSVVFENDTIVWQADPNQTMMTRRGDSAVIRGEAFNASNLTITLCTPYTQHIIDDFVVVVVEQDGERPIILLRAMAVVAVMITGCIMMVGAIRRSL